MEKQVLVGKNELGLEVVNGKVMVSSLQVAEHFGKQHKNVIQAIERLEIPEEFNRLNFQPVEYVDKKGEKRPAYLMTRDGFTLLVMGFTGSQAMQWKIRYIEAFNAMEKMLREGVERDKKEKELDQEMLSRIDDLIEERLGLAVERIAEFLKRSEEKRIPVRKFDYQGKKVRSFILGGEFGLLAEDVARVLGVEGNYVDFLYFLGFKRGEDIRKQRSVFVLLEYGGVCRELGYEDIVYISLEGIEHIKEVDGDFYNFIRQRILPCLPEMQRAYKYLVRVSLKDGKKKVLWERLRQYYSSGHTRYLM